jgi:hypothetical protein
MPPAWRIEVVDRILRVDLTGGIEAGDFEHLYDDILLQVGEADGAVVDLGDATLTATGDSLLDKLVANLRARDIPTTVLRRPPGPGGTADG